jgi:hypothetical protein
VRRPPLEAAVTAVGGGALAALVGAPVGLSVPLGIVGAANGAVSGWRGVYSWRRRQGWAAFALDSSWALVTTAGAVVAHGVAAVRRERGYVAALSERQDRHVYRRGLQIRRGFAITVGNVVSGVGDVSTPSRRRLVTDHEDVHVWQARVFGPVFPLVYVMWLAGGAVVGAVLWAVREREQPAGKVVETCAYYCNPFEWWAYSRDGQWRPRRMAARVGWRRPMVRSLAAKRATRPSRAAEVREAAVRDT